MRLVLTTTLLWSLALANNLHSLNSSESKKDATGYVLPSFMWDLESDTVNLIIDFHDEGERDVVNLQRINSEFGDDEKDEEDGDCILMGYLRDETDVHVTVDGCPGNDVFQVIFNSQRVHDSTFVIHNGTVTAFHQDIHQMSGSNVDENVIILDAGELPEKIWNIDDRELSERALPSSFKVTLSLSYDNLFLNDVCGGNHAMAKGRVEKIIKLAQGYFLDSATLGTKITLEIKEIKHTNHEFRLREKGACNPFCMLKKVGDEIASRTHIDVDNYHVFSADNPGFNDVGGVALRYIINPEDRSIAGSVCLKDKTYRVGISEFWGNPNDWESGKLSAALIFAHELGHSLGMPHDFIDDGANPPNPRRDSSGTSCLIVDGIMGYSKNTKTSRSTCSKESIAGWFKQLTDKGMNCKKGDGCRTVGGSKCVFPFKYRGTVYEKCTKINNEKFDNVPWCSTKVDANGNHVKYQWDNCNSDCP